MADSTEDRRDAAKEQFLYPVGQYRGTFTPENLTFNSNLQEFAQRVSVICALETGGKVAPEDAYEQIKALWHQLKRSKSELLDEPKPPKPDLPE